MKIEFYDFRKYMLVFMAGAKLWAYNEYCN